MHQVVSPVLLLDHAVTHPMYLLRAELAPVHVVPVEGGRGSGLEEGRDGRGLVAEGNVKEKRKTTENIVYAKVLGL